MPLRLPQSPSIWGKRERELGYRRISAAAPRSVISPTPPFYHSGEPHWGNKMERMGPEASLMMSSAARRSDLTEFAGLEYSRTESRRVEAMLHGQIEVSHSERAFSIRLAGWFRSIFRRPDGRLAGELASHPKVSSRRAESLAQFSTLPALGLAAVSATRTGAYPEGSVSPLSVAPIRDRV
jgi:hypothetical protein